MNMETDFEAKNIVKNAIPQRFQEKPNKNYCKNRYEGVNYPNDNEEIKNNNTVMKILVNFNLGWI